MLSKGGEEAEVSRVKGGVKLKVGSSPDGGKKSKDQAVTGVEMEGNRVAEKYHKW